MILNKSDVVFHEFHVQRLRHGRRLALAAERLVKSSCDEKERPRDGWSRTPAPRPLRDRSISAPTCDTSRRRPALDGAFLCFAVSAWACPVSCELPLTDRRLTDVHIRPRSRPDHDQRSRSSVRVSTGGARRAALDRRREARPRARPPCLGRVQQTQLGELRATDTSTVFAGEGDPGLTVTLRGARCSLSPWRRAARGAARAGAGQARAAGTTRTSTPSPRPCNATAPMLHSKSVSTGHSHS